MEAIYLPAAQRDVFGKKVKTLRKSGLIPLHLYGRGMPSISLHGNSQEVAKAISRVGQHMPLNLQIESSSEPELVFVREVQYHPVTNQILHVDLVRVDVSQAITGEVPISLSGEAPAVRSQGGVLVQSMYRLLVESLPLEMPERIDVDISSLEELDQSIRVSDIAASQGVKLVGDLDEIIVRITSPRVQQSVEDSSDSVGSEHPVDEGITEAGTD